jgi:hypothetical protein
MKDGDRCRLTPAVAVLRVDRPIEFHEPGRRRPQRAAATTCVDAFCAAVAITSATVAACVT